MYGRQNQNQGEARLELLLDDLQSTLPRKNHGLGNTSSTGYREITKSTSRTIGDGQTETNKEYEIQYLNPSNKSTVLSERLPDLQSVDLLRQTNNGKNAGYETSSYQYKKSTESKSTLPRHETNGVNMRQSISELDSLLDDLNHAQRVGFSNSGVNRHEMTTTETTIEPLRSSTPYKHYGKQEEHRYGSLNRSKVPVGTTEMISTYETTKTNGEPMDLVDAPRSYTKLLQNQSPGTYQTSVYSKETTKKIIPGTTTYSTYQKFGSPTTDPGQSKVYNYSEEYRTENRNRSLRDLPPSPRLHRSSSPRSPSPHRSPSPVSFAQPPEPRNYSSSSHSYTSKNVSPQSVQKFSPSDPSRINEEVTWVANATPPVTRRFPVSVDNTFSTPPGQTVYTYKYSTETRENTKYGHPNGYTSPVYQDQLPLRQSPFPRDDADSPSQQNPPKRLDDLMASFGDKTDYSTYRSNREYHTNVNDYQSKSKEYVSDNRGPVEYTVPIKKPHPENQVLENRGPEKLQTEVKENEITKSTAGPPVFYPPGSTTFVKKEEVMQQQGQYGQGQMKAKGKGMYKYKSKSKAKESSNTKTTMVPVCLPMCCAMPCVIM